jgi:hypothetical protein
MVVDKTAGDPVIPMLAHGIAKIVKSLLRGVRRYDPFNIALQIFRGRGRQSGEAEPMGAIRACVAAPDKQPR